MLMKRKKYSTTQANQQAEVVYITNHNSSTAPACRNNKRDRVGRLLSNTATQQAKLTVRPFQNCHNGAQLKSCWTRNCYEWKTLNISDVFCQTPIGI